jgi:hypothetical protein
MEKRQQQADACVANLERSEAAWRVAGSWPNPIKETPTEAEQDRWQWCDYLARKYAKQDEENLS